jgi:hypothetical protein
MCLFEHSNQPQSAITNNSPTVTGLTTDHGDITGHSPAQQSIHLHGNLFHAAGENNSLTVTGLTTADYGDSPAQQSTHPHDCSSCAAIEALCVQCSISAATIHSARYKSNRGKKALLARVLNHCNMVDFKIIIVIHLPN